MKQLYLSRTSSAAYSQAPEKSCFLLSVPRSADPWSQMKSGYFFAGSKPFGLSRR